jgi:pimeloyl-ACP methyl ester carboxylesterase
MKDIRLPVILLLLAVIWSGCYTRIQKPIMSKREYESFQEKEYPAATQYIQVNDSNLAYIEKGKGATVILVHGGVIPMSVYHSVYITTLWDALTFAPGGLFMLSDTTIGLPMTLFSGYYLFPQRAKSLIHLGAVSTIDTWNYNFDELAENFHVIAVDLPGFGNSEKPDMKYRVPDFTRYLKAFMEAKGIEKASLVGHDLGGLIAMDFALTFPENVNSLVLIAPYGTMRYGFPSSVINLSHYPRPIGRAYQRDKAGQVNTWLPLISRYGKHTYRRILHRFQPEIMGSAESWASSPAQLIHLDEGNSKEFMDQVVDYKFDYIKTKEFSDELQATHLALVDAGRYDLLNIIKMDPEKRTDWVTRVKDIQAPALVVWGAYDPSFAKCVSTCEESEYLDAAIPNSMVNIFENSGHYPMVEQSEKFNKDVTIFLKGTAP